MSAAVIAAKDERPSALGLLSQLRAERDVALETTRAAIRDLHERDRRIVARP